MVAPDAGEGECTQSGGEIATTAGFSCFVCSKPAKLQCPTCRESFRGGGGGGMQLGWTKEKSVFCSQECFKKVWKEHKLAFHSNKDQYSLQKGWGYAVQRGAARVSAPPPLPFGFSWTGPLRPEKVGPMRSVPTSIPRPDWAEHGRPIHEEQSKWQRTIPVLRSDTDLAGIRKACRLARECLDMAASMVKPGVTTDEIDEAVHKMAVRNGAYPSPLNYYNFPKSCCTSVNEVVCHGIPDLRPLEEVRCADDAASATRAAGSQHTTAITGGTSPLRRALSPVSCRE